MNRIIKFRAWIPSENRMGKSFKLIQGLNERGKFDEDIVFMEWTGLTDKNGKEVYEGDIVEAILWNKEKSNELVEWSEGIIGFLPFCNYDRDCDGAPDKNQQEATYIVIGNIYESPELFKGGDK